MEDAKRRTSPDLIAAISRIESRPASCGVARAMVEMTDDEKIVLVSAIDNEDIGPMELSRVLREHGFDVSDRMIYRHRRRSSGGCSCPK